MDKQGILNRNIIIGKALITKNRSIKIKKIKL